LEADDSSSKLLLLGIFALLLGFSAFFSSSESAIFSLPSFRLERLKEEKKPYASLLASLMETPHRLLITILTGNTLVNTLAASIAAVLTISLTTMNETVAILIGLVGITFLLLITGEVTPKLYAINRAESVSLRAAPILRVFGYLFYPLTQLFLTIFRAVSFLVPSTDGKKLTLKQFIALVEVAKEHGVLIEEVEKIAIDAFAFGEKKVNEVMTPRVDIESLSSDVTAGDAREAFREFTHSRIPIYSETLDHVDGVVYSKDVLLEQDGDRPIRFLARKPYFVPENKEVLTLMRELQAEKTTIAVVVDEYGGTSGLITLEDIVEELVGEIRDEFDVEPPLIRRIAPGVFVVNPIVDIHQFNEHLGVNLPTDDFPTLAGIILDRAGKVPEEGESVELDSLTLRVEEVRENRIERVRVFLL
jgi:CBS domain containing-hemolysin-like protein